ncbi:UNVERIFIED_CONTAM: hypothetical protein K2H54_002012 [Gekko kuhli]
MAKAAIGQWAKTRGKTLHKRKKNPNSSSSPVAKTTLETFFPPNVRQDDGNSNSTELLEMASDSVPIEGDFSTASESDTLTVSKQEIIEIHKDLHRSLRETVEELIQPLDKKLENFMTELRDTTQKADANTAKCTSLQEKVNKLQATEAAMNTRLLLLENRWRQHNLKFRGFEEGAEENTELSTFIAKWLAHVLQLEDGVAPAIAKAYRLGPLA